MPRSQSENHACDIRRPTPCLWPQPDPTLPCQGHCENNPGLSPSPSPFDCRVSLPEHVDLCQLCGLDSTKLLHLCRAGSREAITATPETFSPQKQWRDEELGSLRGLGLLSGEGLLLGHLHLVITEGAKVLSPLLDQLSSAPVSRLSAFVFSSAHLPVSSHDVPKVVASLPCLMQGHQVTFHSL